jgi:hypothetical protein
VSTALRRDTWPMTEAPDAIEPDRTGKDRPDDGSQSLTRLIAPVFAAFTLPTIFAFSSSTKPGQPWHDIVLSLLIASTGLFMASIQFSIGTLYTTYRNAGKFRAGLTLIGLAFVTASLFFAVMPLIDSLWLWLPLCVLLVGGLAPGLWILRLESPGWRWGRRFLRAKLEPLPTSWHLTGSRTGDYEAGLLPEAKTYHGSRVMRLRLHTVDEPIGSGALMQSTAAASYVGRRVRFSVMVRAHKVTGWAGLWLRIDGPEGVLALDNVQRQPLSGTTSWTRADIVLDVPSQATELHFGVLLSGAGAVDLTSPRLERFRKDLLITAKSSTPGPLPEEP